jgi:hypothetical protein
MKALLALAIFAAMPVGAQVTYDYSGQPMTLTGLTSSESGGMQIYTVPYEFLGDVVLSQALNPNQANQQLVPLAYKWNDPGTGPGPGFLGGLYYSAKIPYGSPLEPVGPNPVAWPGAAPPGFEGIEGIPTLDFSTANGKITSFSMTFGGALGNYGAETLTISSAGDSYSSSESIPDCMCSGSWNGLNMVGGTWTKAPEINPSVAATALTLLCGGVLILKGRRRT